MLGELMTHVPAYMAAPPKTQHQNRWNPYQFHGGTVFGITGEGFVVIAGDRRMTNNGLIIHRNFSKLWQVTDNALLCCVCMEAEYLKLKEVVSRSLEEYEYKMGRKPSLQSLCSLISRTLYSRRFFPYYTFIMIAGINEEGRPVLYNYDGIGSYSEERVSGQGTAVEMLLPLLDSLQRDRGLTSDKEKLMEYMANSLRLASEHNVETGDVGDVWLIEKGRVVKKGVELRKD